MRLHLSVSLAVVCAGGSAAQTTPDFSGEWVLLDPADVGPDIARELTVSYSPEGRMDVLHVERRSETTTQSTQHRIGVTGGVVGGVGAPNRRPTQQSRFSATWQEKKLVIETATSSGQPGDRPDSERIEVWSLEGPDRLRIGLTVGTSNSPPMKLTLTYRRR